MRKHLQAAGIEIVRGPIETGYGCTEMDVMDPDGHRLCFGVCQ